MKEKSKKTTEKCCQDRTLKKCFSVPRSGFCDEVASQNGCHKEKQDNSRCDQTIFQRPDFRSGFVSIIGKPNVGKSSLLNALVGEKVSIVSPKSQTTRDKILGLRTTDDYQLVFIDTPGIHNYKQKLGQYMKKEVSAATVDVDAIVVVIDGSKKIDSQDIDLIERYLKTTAEVFVVINKTDLGKFEKVYPLIEKLSHFTKGERQVNQIIPISCKTGLNVDVLLQHLIKILPTGAMYYPKDDITDKPIKYLVGEIIREKALLFLQDEIPHGIGVYIGKFEEQKTIVNIEADIICEKDGHKQIIIGRDGDKLKQIGTSARQEIEKLVDSKVFLQLYVKVKENWRNKQNVMNDIGYIN